MKFKVGDKIRCVDVGVGSSLILNSVYTVIRTKVGLDNVTNYVDISGYFTDGFRKEYGGFFASRFVYAYKNIPKED